MFFFSIIKKVRASSSSYKPRVPLNHGWKKGRYRYVTAVNNGFGRDCYTVAVGAPTHLDSQHNGCYKADTNILTVFFKKEGKKKRAFLSMPASPF